MTSRRTGKGLASNSRNGVHPPSGSSGKEQTDKEGHWIGERKPFPSRVIEKKKKVKLEKVQELVRFDSLNCSL